jgi:hypothetical protein
VVYIYNPSYLGGRGKEASPREKYETLHENVLKQKGLGTMVEHLPSKCKALNSNPNTAKKKIELEVVS